MSSMTRFNITVVFLEVVPMDDEVADVKNALEGKDGFEMAFYDIIKTLVMIFICLVLVLFIGRKEERSEE